MLVQVQMACELQKPLFLHCRDAGERFAAILRCDPSRASMLPSTTCLCSSGCSCVILYVDPDSVSNQQTPQPCCRRHQLQAPAVQHCFTGSRQELMDALSMGLHIGITGWYAFLQVSLLKCSGMRTAMPATQSGAALIMLFCLSAHEAAISVCQHVAECRTCSLWCFSLHASMPTVVCMIQGLR